MPDEAGWPSRFALAWRILTYDKGRTALAVAGVLLAILLVFVQLGFFIAVPRGGMLLYDRTRFDLLVASTGYEYQVQPGAFPLSLLDKGKTAPEVALAAPLYFGSAKWRSGEHGKAPDVFVIGLDKKIKLILVYPMTTGRNFDEVLRVIDSLQLTAKHGVATPVNWERGEDVIIAGSVSDEDAKKTYPGGWKAPKPYIRIVPQPRS